MIGVICLLRTFQLIRRNQIMFPRFVGIEPGIFREFPDGSYNIRLLLQQISPLNILIIPQYDLQINTVSINIFQGLTDYTYAGLDSGIVCSDGPLRQHNL